MTRIHYTLVPGQYAPTTDTAIYTAGSGDVAVIDTCTAANVSSATAALTVRIVPNGGTLTDAERSILTHNIAAGSTDLCPELVGKVLQPLDMLVVKSAVDSAITLHVTARKFTV